MTTIRDVAREAGVSVGTASRALSGNATVAADLRARVAAAVAALGYRPNLAAQTLRTNRTDIIGLVLPDITNPFFAQLAKEIEAAASARGLSVMLSNSLGDAALEAVRVTAILDRGPRGVIVVPSRDGIRVPRRAGIPCIALDRAIEGLPLVAIDNALSAALAADHLLGLGHRRLAYIAGPAATAVARDRERGFTARIAALARDLGPIEVARREGAFDYASGERLTRELLPEAPAPALGRVTAIAAASDQQAIGVVRAARDLGVRVPEDLSVIGFDDIALADLIVPRLATIRQPVRVLAEAAIRRVLDPEDGPSDDRFLGELVIRGSTARAGR